MILLFHNNTVYENYRIVTHLHILLYYITWFENASFVHSNDESFKRLLTRENDAFVDRRQSVTRPMNGNNDNRQVYVPTYTYVSIIRATQ